MAQKFTVSELIELYENDNDFFDTYVISKGYKFSRSTDGNLYYGVFDVNGNEEMFNSVSVHYIKNKYDSTQKPERSIAWSFKSDSIYLSVKKDLIAKGFSVYYDYSGKDDYADKHHFLFENNTKDQRKKYQIELVTAKPKIYKVPIYYLLIER